jgi:hypothetical protein
MITTNTEKAKGSDHFSAQYRKSGWVDLNLASKSDLMCFTSSSVISVVEALMYSLMSMLYVAS